MKGGRPRLSDETRWYSEHTALLISTLKWAMLGAGTGVCVGLGTRAFLWAVGASDEFTRSLLHGRFPAFLLLPLALPACVWLIRTFAPDAEGHGTEAVIAAIHQQSGRIRWSVAPVKLAATVLTLTFGGSVGKEGPAAQIGAALTSLFADLLKLSDSDRRRLVICGISAGFAAVFGTPISGALFGIEVLYLGRIDYSVIFPAMVAGIIGHLVCGGHPIVPQLHQSFGDHGQLAIVLLSIASGGFFGLVALAFIETMRGFERWTHRFSSHPYLLAMGGGIALVAIYFGAGDAYAGLGTSTLDGVLTGSVTVMTLAFAVKIVTTSISLESGGSGGVITPIFFIGATSGAALAHLVGVPTELFAAFGLVAVLAATTNTPLAAAVMAIELLPSPEGVYAALAAAAAFLMVGHRSIYASQKLGLSKSAGLEVELGGTMGEFDVRTLRLRRGSFAERVHNLGGKEEEDAPPRGDE